MILLKKPFSLSVDTVASGGQAKINVLIPQQVLFSYLSHHIVIIITPGLSRVPSMLSRHRDVEINKSSVSVFIIVPKDRISNHKPRISHCANI